MDGWWNIFLVMVSFALGVWLPLLLVVALFTGVVPREHGDRKASMVVIISSLLHYLKLGTCTPHYIPIGYWWRGRRRRLVEVVFILLFGLVIIIRTLTLLD